MSGEGVDEGVCLSVGAGMVLQKLACPMGWLGFDISISGFLFTSFSHSYGSMKRVGSET